MRRSIRYAKNALGAKASDWPETTMKAVRIHEYGGPEKLQFEDGVLLQVPNLKFEGLDLV